MKKTYKELNEAESRKDALKRALEISKWKKAGGKVKKQPPNPASGMRRYRGMGISTPMGKEDEKMAKDLKAYRKKLKKKKKNEGVEEGYQEISNLVDITQEVMGKMIKAMKRDDFKSVTKLYKELGNIIK